MDQSIHVLDACSITVCRVDLAEVQRDDLGPCPLEIESATFCRFSEERATSTNFRPGLGGRVRQRFSDPIQRR